MIDKSFSFDEPQGVSHEEYMRQKLRVNAYCKYHKIPRPAWIKIRAHHQYEQKNWLIKPEHTPTQSDRFNARKYAEKNNLPIPAWAMKRKKQPKRLEPKFLAEENEIFNIFAVMCEVGLAEVSGMDCFWNNAEVYAAKVWISPALLLTVTTRNADETKSRCVELLYQYGVDYNGIMETELEKLTRHKELIEKKRRTDPIPTRSALPGKPGRPSHGGAAKTAGGKAAQTKFYEFGYLGAKKKHG